jgi:hypothetical protein
VKWFLALLLVVGVGLVVAGPPPPVPTAHRAVVSGAGRPILPMTFFHDDHLGVFCATCHHEFVDGTTGSSCIDCHVTDPAVSALLEQQFHDLCRSCHVEERAAGKDAGPTRSCIACHLPDDRI